MGTSSQPGKIRYGENHPGLRIERAAATDSDRPRLPRTEKRSRFVHDSVDVRTGPVGRRPPSRASNASPSDQTATAVFVPPRSTPRMHSPLVRRLFGEGEEEDASPITVSSAGRFDGPRDRGVEFRTMKSILVTGGAGFVGSHLCERLLARGDEVICADNYFTGSRRNIEHLLGHLASKRSVTTS